VLKYLIFRKYFFSFLDGNSVFCGTHDPLPPELRIRSIQSSGSVPSRAQDPLHPELRIRSIQSSGSAPSRAQDPLPPELRIRSLQRSSGYRLDTEKA
jgi:hypothetical protein